jgi:acetolactate synthase-1/3 small subunit
MLHTFSVYVRERPGVLNRVASLFRQRGFNIDSLTVGHTQRPGISRMTIAVDIAEGRLWQVEANLYKLMDVTMVEEIRDSQAIAHELALIKICAAKDLKVSLPKELVDQFNARVVAQGPESLILEATGTPDQIDVLVEMLRPCVILEMARTGRLAIGVGPPLRLERGVPSELGSLKNNQTRGIRHFEKSQSHLRRLMSRFLPLKV